MDSKIVQQLYICNRNFRELRSEKPYMIITQVQKMHLEKIMFVITTVFWFKFILKFPGCTEEATSLTEIFLEKYGVER